VRLASSRRGLRILAIVVLVAAVLPNVLYLGHSPGAEAAHEHNGAESRGTDEHELHCHKGPSRCAGPQSLTGSIWAGEDAGLLSLDRPVRAFVETRTESAADGVTARVLQPPRTAG
jgi:hypothetical protein